MTKKTKIVATVSDLRGSEDFLRELYRNGMNVVRLNSAHQAPEQAAHLIDVVRSVSPSIGILVDTKGPEVRTSAHGETLAVEVGKSLRVVGDPDGVSQGDTLYVTMLHFAEQVPLGSSLLIDDGELELVVTAKEGEALVCFPQSQGEIKNRKSVNVPNVELDLPAVSEKDRRFLAMAAQKQVDFVAHSFVRTAQDVQEVQALLTAAGATAKIIAKIENQQGVDNIDQILDVTYGVMVARGDLGIEIPEERVPEVQRMIVRKCIESKKPVIIATQMLHSMIENPRPTRAEISDVASAIYQRADAIMLSGETAYGKYPVQAVRTMERIATEIESHLQSLHTLKLHRVKNVITETLSHAAVDACKAMPIKAIVLDTLSGRTARYIAAYRGRVPIYAMCYRQEVMSQLSLTYGVEAYYVKRNSTRDMFMIESIHMLLTQEKVKPMDLILVVGGSFGPSNGASFMEIGEVRNILAVPNPHGNFGE